MPPSTWPPSPTVTCSTRTSPLTLPSIWSSPPLETLPSGVISAPMTEEPLPEAGRGADRGGSECDAGAVAGAAGCGVGAGVGHGWLGCGVLEFGLLNIVAGLYEAHGVLGTSVDPHFV